MTKLLGGAQGFAVLAIGIDVHAQLAVLAILLGFDHHDGMVEAARTHWPPSLRLVSCRLFELKIKKPALLHALNEGRGLLARNLFKKLDAVDMRIALHQLLGKALHVLHAQL